MKKVLLSMFVAGAGILSAQTFTFEQSEGFFPGDITGQSDEWQATPFDGGGNIDGQVIVEGEGVNGSQAFKNAYMEDYGSQTGPIIGAFYTPSEPIVIDEDFSFSYDFKGEWNGELSDFVVQLYANDAEGVGQIVQFMDFNYVGGFSYVGFDETGGLAYVGAEGYEWEPNVWHTAKIEHNGIDLDLYIDGEMYGSIYLHSSDPITEVRFVSDNYGFDGYYDNVSFNGDLAVSDIEGAKSVTSVYPNPARAMVNVRLAEDFDANKTTVKLTNVTGKTVAQFADVNSVNVNKLPAGVYFMTITDGNKTETKKLIKK